MQVVDRLRAVRRGDRPVRVPPAWARARHLLATGDHDRLLAEAPRLRAELADQPHGAGYEPALVLAVGAELTAREQVGPAIATLHEGLRLLPGTPAEDEVDGSWYALALTELLLVVGDLPAAAAWADALVGPDRPLEVRLGATRATAHLRSLGGDPGGAHQLLNTATGMAARARSGLLAALVESDRAVVLAAQGRTAEAVRLAAATVEALGRPVAGGHGLQATAQAAATAAAVGLAAHDAGDELSAHQLAEVAHRVAADDPRGLVRAHVALAAAAAAAAARDPWAAEGPAREAQRLAAAVPAPPLASRAVRLQGDLAVATHRLASAGPLYRRALDDQRRLGLVADAATTTRALAALEA